MKNPALHITTSSLIELLSEFARVDDPKHLAITLVREAHARGMQLRNRAIVKAPAKKATKIKRMATFDSNTADLFQGLLINARRAMGHKMVKVLRPSDAQFALLKEVAELAAEFAASFNMEVKDGMLRFCDIGIFLMGSKFSLSKFKYYSEQIAQYEEASILVTGDANYTGTKMLFELWVEIVKEEAGFTRTLKDPREYINMLYARQQADELKADYEQWLRAQFDGFKWLGIIPEPYQLHGDKAKLRYEIYMTHKGAKVKADAEQKASEPEAGPDAYWAALERLGQEDDDE